MVTSQLDRWTGEFGREYTDRNIVDWESRVEGFRRMIPPNTRTILEVGCNRGHNLLALKAAFPHLVDAFGTEPAEYPRWLARTQGLDVRDWPVNDLPRPWRYHIDLIFTSGVLIHVPPESLDDAMRQIHKLARKHILAIEYDGDDEAIDYRGHTDMLWKRNYGKHYQRLFPDLKLIDVGDAPAGFERATYWLLKK